MTPCRLRRRKFRKFDYEMVHSEVYLNKYVVSIAPFSKHSFTPPLFRKLLFFACFRFLTFHLFSRGSADPIHPHVRTPTRTRPIFTNIIMCTWLGQARRDKSSLCRERGVGGGICNAPLPCFSLMQRMHQRKPHHIWTKFATHIHTHTHTLPDCSKRPLKQSACKCTQKALKS